MSSDPPPLPPAVPGPMHRLDARAGPLAVYTGPVVASPPRPLLLIHSINAAASAYEMRPLYEHYAPLRPVYALDLPGFSHSDRSDRAYTPRLMTDAILDVVDLIGSEHGTVPVDAIALSLSTEFLARAASERPERFASLSLISPTAFDRRAPRYGAPGTNRGMNWLYKIFTAQAWTRGFYRLLTSRPSVRFFLRKTWGSKDIDEGLLEYDLVSARQPGARHAPYYFVSGFLFSADITRVYESLQMPIWLSHGVRGDFVDYRYAAVMAQRPNWKVEVFQSGAMPHFELRAEFLDACDRFLAGAAAG